MILSIKQRQIQCGGKEMDGEDKGRKIDRLTSDPRKFPQLERCLTSQRPSKMGSHSNSRLACLISCFFSYCSSEPEG